MDSGEMDCICERPVKRFDEAQSDDDFKNCAVCNGYFIDSQKETEEQYKKRTEAG